jgi:PAS domain S-box-containing protein
MKTQRECDRLAARADEIFCDLQQRICRRNDRMFAAFLALQWPAAVVIALSFTPKTWNGAEASVHPHVMFAVVWGLVFCGLPALIAWRWAGATATRYLISIAQVAFSSLLIQLLGGRIEAHFHVFVSLILLSAYRDWKVLVPATAFVAADHLVRSVSWPYTVFGVATASPWRALEHALWVLLADVFLILTIQKSRTEMRAVALQTATLEHSNEEVRRYSEQLAASIEKERDVIEGALDAVIQIDRNGRVVSWNTKAEQIFGWTAAEALARPVDELVIPPDARAAQVDGLRRFHETGLGPVLNKRLEVDAIRRDGTIFPVEIAITPVRSGSEQLFCAFLRDITARKRYEEELRQAKELAEAANRTKSEFLANMSHEIRTPLNGILGFTELLIRDQNIGEAERRDYIRTIRSSGKHLLELINDILDLSKIEAGQLQVERTACSPHHLIAEVVSVLRARAQEKGITLDYRWDSDIPEAIPSDPYRLRQLLMNLVGNAVKFTEQGGVDVVARLTPVGSRAELVLEVRDTGIGIAQEHLEDIFKPFVQADNSVTRRFGGTGLGLTITRNICESLGGSLAVESELGRGSTFTATLPAGDLADVRVNERPPEQGRGDIVDTREGKENLDGLRILLVDDGETNRKLIQLFLARQGADVTTAENGELAVAATRGAHFDVILMDMQMPVMDGYAATRRLRSQGYDKPIIALTAHAMLGDRNRCEEAGCSGYLTKPVNVDELVRVVRSAAGGGSGAIPWSTAARAASAASAAAPIRSTLPLDDPEIRALVAEFAATVPQRIDAIAQALATLDFDQAASLAHALKGAGGTAGFHCLTEASARLESSARQRQQDEAGGALENLRELNQRMVV